MHNLITAQGSFSEPSLEELTRRLRAIGDQDYWLDFEAPDEDDYRFLQDVLGFHPLTIEDLRHQNQRPKIEDYPGYAFVVIFLARWKEGEVQFLEHHLYVARRYLVTVHEAASPELADLRQRITTTPELVRNQPGFLTYMVVDRLVDALFPVLDQLDDAVDRLEDEILARATPADLVRISDLKHQVTELRRFLGPQRDLFQRLISRSIDAHDQELMLYYRDVYDHVVRQYEMVDALRDLVTSAMDVYLSTVSNRLNVTMKQLTVVASLFLPLTFLTGFFGQNFGFLVNRIGSPFAFALGVLIMLGSVALQLYIFHQRDWI